MNFAFNTVKKIGSQFGSDLRAARGMASLVTGLREFFCEPVTLEKAKEEIGRALETREERFLDLIRIQVCDREGSPYLKLLRIAGCDFADLQTLIRRQGLEKSLQRLAEEGVYLTSDEFKGKKDVIRGGQSFRIIPKALEPQYSRPAAIVVQSSGTRNRPQRYALSLDRMATQALLTSVLFSAHELFSCSHAIFDAALPSSGGARHLLSFSKMGVLVDRWFAPRVPMGSWPEATYHYLMTYLIVWGTRCFGPGAPSPEFLDNQQTHRVVNWITENKKSGRLCCVRATASNAVRVARAALEKGESLAGTKFIVSGEPLTKAKRDFIERLEGHTISHYGSGGLHHVGSGCADSPHLDDVHVARHLLAVIQQPASFNSYGEPIFPFLFTTLSSLASKLHLNVENGDYGVMEERHCGCALEKAGLTLHLHQIRSFEKFTSEGMNYFYGDLHELLGGTFPSEFGGSPGDYQLAEEEDANGQTRLTLVVHPNVGVLDDAKVLIRLRNVLADGSRNNRFITGVWENAGTFRIKREAPYSSPRGKILPLQMLRRQG